ncbi:hypothetical protein MTO96_019487 [Rhipicephalus appendiculatus]
MEPRASGSAGNAAAETNKSTATSPSGTSGPGQVVSPAPSKGLDTKSTLRHRRSTSRPSQATRAQPQQHPTDTPSFSVTTSPLTADAGAHASEPAAATAETSDDAKPGGVPGVAKHCERSPLKLADTKNSLSTQKARAKSALALSPAATRQLLSKGVVPQGGTAAGALPPRSPAPMLEEARVDKKVPSGQAPVIATASLRRSMLKTASSPLPTGGGIKRATSVDAGALSESPAATDDIESPTTRRKSSVRFGATSIREISHVTASLIEHHRQLVALFSIGFLSVLISAGGALLFFMLRQEHPHYLNGCSTTGCKRAVRDLERLIDVSIDPCHDFYGHVCHRWLSRYDAGYLERAARDLLRDLNNSLNEVDEPMRVSPRLFSLARFYQLCTRFISTRTLQLSDMLQPFQQYADLLALSTFSELIGRVIELSLVRGVRTLLDIRLVRMSKAAVRLRISCGISLAQKCCDNSSAELDLYLGTLLSGVSEMLQENGGPPRPLNPSDIAGMDTNLHPLMVAPINEQNYNISLCRRGPASGKHSRVIVTNVDAIRTLLYYVEKYMDIGVVYVYVQAAHGGHALRLLTPPKRKGSRRRR